MTWEWYQAFSQFSSCSLRSRIQWGKWRGRRPGDEATKTVLTTTVNHYKLWGCTAHYSFVLCRFTTLFTWCCLLCAASFIRTTVPSGEGQFSSTNQSTITPLRTCPPFPPLSDTDRYISPRSIPYLPYYALLSSLLTLARNLTSSVSLITGSLPSRVWNLVLRHTLPHTVGRVRRTSSQSTTTIAAERLPGGCKQPPEKSKKRQRKQHTHHRQ